MNSTLAILTLIFFGFRYVSTFNEQCSNRADCPSEEKTDCISNTCQCDGTSQFDESLSKCLHHVTEFGAICLQDWQCQDFLGDNAQCVNNACLCQTGYRWYQGKCQKYAQKGDSCNKDVLCFDGNDPLALICDGFIFMDGKCVCNDGYYDRGEDCRLESKMGGDCAINADCFPSPDTFGLLTNSTCELGKCVEVKKIATSSAKAFNNTFTYSDRSYLETLIEDSVTDNPEDDDDIVPCSTGVSSDLEEDECLECPNAMYFKNSICVCQPGFFLQDGDCIAELGMNNPNALYKVDADCPIRPGKVVDGICYCKDYWFQENTNRECKKTTLEYTRNCLDNDWCKAMGPYAFCNTQTEKCQCINEAVLNETSFYCEPKADADLTTICLASSECPLYETCSDESCQCNSGFYRTEKGAVCLPKIGSSCEVRDCDHINHALCDHDLTCQCSDRDTYVTDGLLCLEKVTALYMECRIPEQCSGLSNAECRGAGDDDSTTSLCLCKDDFTDINGTCYAVKSPGSTCTTELDCTRILGETFECRNSLCQCPIGWTLTSKTTCSSSSSDRPLLHTMMPVLALIVFLSFR